MARVVYERLQFTEHAHSGRHRPHEHTSYPLLFILLIIVGLVLSITTVAVQAQSPGPEAGSIGLTGTMPGPAPTTAAVIESPTNGQRFDESPITVSGTCPTGTLVEILKNNIFGGAVFCDDNGRFSLELDLLIGRNSLVARVYDALNQPGPNSKAVVVFYDALPPQGSDISPLDFRNAQLLLSTDAVYRGLFPGQELNMPIEIIGGTPPFAVNVLWGDSENSIVPRENNQPFTATHIYQRPGRYAITLQATDDEGRVAFLTVAALVNGTPSPLASSDDRTAAVNKFLVLWPLYVGSFTTTVSFWLGERREKHILAKRGLLNEEAEA